MAAENQLPIPAHRRGRPVHHFLLEGDSNVGKTSLIRAYASGRPNSLLHDDENLRIFSEIDIVDGEECVVELRDLEEEERRTLTTRHHWFDGVFLIFALNNKDSLYNLSTTRFERLKCVPLELKSLFPCVVLANKRDVAQDAPTSRPFNDDILEAWCARKRMPYFKTSNRNVDVDIMKSAVDELVRKSIAYKAAYSRFRISFPADEESQLLVDDSPETSGSCNCSCC